MANSLLWIALAFPVVLVLLMIGAWLYGFFYPEKAPAVSDKILGHRVGRVRSRFDVAYGVLIFQWIVYVAGTPLTLWVAYLAVSKSPAIAILFISLYCFWIFAAAIMLGHPQLVLLAPGIIVIDLLYRVIFVHALIKALRQPTVTACKWDSPTRFAPILLPQIHNNQRR